MLAVAPEPWLVVPYVMAAQALSGIAKDLTKMSSKSAVKLVVPQDAPARSTSGSRILTGSKNALKGVGFFLGGLLLTLVGFQPALLILLGSSRPRLLGVLALMRGDLGRPDRKAQVPRRCSRNNRAVNMLAAARIFLFAVARRVVRRRRCRCSCTPSSAGASGRSAGSWRSGSSATASCRPPHRASSRRRATARRARRADRGVAGLRARGVPGGDRHRADGRRRPDAWSSSPA